MTVLDAPELGGVVFGRVTFERQSITGLGRTVHAIEVRLRLFLKSFQYRLVPRIYRHLLSDRQLAKRLEISLRPGLLVKVKRALLGPKIAHHIGMLAHCSANKLGFSVLFGHANKIGPTACL